MLHYRMLLCSCESFSLARRQVSDSGLARLAGLPQLLVVDVRGCFRVTAGGAATACTTADGRLCVVTGSDAFDAVPAALLGHDSSVRDGYGPLPLHFSPSSRIACCRCSLQTPEAAYSYPHLLAKR